jgi:hypothetical protein
MSRRMKHQQILVLSDIHYACPAEQDRKNHERELTSNPFLRLATRCYRDYVWLRNPQRQNHLLDEFLRRSGNPDWVIANGDYSCDTAFIGVSDEAARTSATECLGKLRSRFGTRFQAIVGDHELGKLSLVGGKGGMRVASWNSARLDLGLEPFWKLELGNYLLLGVTSSLIAFPAYEPETLPEERPQWLRLREEHWTAIRIAFHELDPAQKVILFCHDPTALPFLRQDEAVGSKLPQVEQTIIGHLHSPFILWKSRLLAGMPAVPFLGNTVRRLSAALREAKHWRPFKVRLCPSLAGIELLKDGGYLSMEVDPSGREPAQIVRHRIPR